MTGRLTPLTLLMFSLGITADVHAQRRADPLPVVANTPVDSARRQSPGPFRLLRVAKWSVLAGAAGTGIWGFLRNDRADELYSELEQACELDRTRCLDRGPGGVYNDPVFEARYQKVRALDRDSHRALVISQIGLAASVVLFLLDLGNSRPPPDIPYVPRGLNVGTERAGGVSLELRLPLDAPRRD
jgi:hypothetical protein